MKGDPPQVETLLRHGHPIFRLCCCVLILLATGCWNAPPVARQSQSPEIGSPWVSEVQESSAVPEAVEPVEPVAEPEPTDPGPPVTNIWVDAEMRAVFRDITAQTGVLIIPDGMVEGVISLEAKDMPVEECLDRIAKTGPWGYKKVGNYYVFGSVEPGSQLVDMLGEIKRVKLNYTTADEVHCLLPGRLARYVHVGKGSNTLAVAAPKPIFDRILENIVELDVRPQQVIVEVLVVQLSEKGRKELGVDWEWQKEKITAGFDTLVGTFTYDAGSSLAHRINVTLKALLTRDEAKVLANPRLAALDREQASIYVGEEKYYTLLSGYTDRPYYTLQSIKAGVTLKITPHIGSNGEITMAIAPEVSEVATNWDTNGNNLPVINRRTACTTVRVKDGQTILIGGLLHEEKSKVHQKVPLLGDIPLLGVLFRKTKDTSVQTEVVIFITSHLITETYPAKSREYMDKFQPLPQPISLKP